MPSQHQRKQTAEQQTHVRVLPTAKWEKVEGVFSAEMRTSVSHTENSASDCPFSVYTRCAHTYMIGSKEECVLLQSTNQSIGTNRLRCWLLVIGNSGKVQSADTTTINTRLFETVQTAYSFIQAKENGAHLDSGAFGRRVSLCVAVIPQTMLELS